MPRLPLPPFPQKSHDLKSGALPFPRHPQLFLERGRENSSVPSPTQVRGARVTQSENSPSQNPTTATARLPSLHPLLLCIRLASCALPGGRPASCAPRPLSVVLIALSKLNPKRSCCPALRWGQKDKRGTGTSETPPHPLSTSALGCRFSHVIGLKAWV